MEPDSQRKMAADSKTDEFVGCQARTVIYTNIANGRIFACTLDFTAQVSSAMTEAIYSIRKRCSRWLRRRESWC